MDASDFSQLYAIWRNEGLTPLSLIQGYTNLLLENGSGSLNEEQHQAVEAIGRACEKAVDCWNQPSTYLQLISEFEFVQKEEGTKDQLGVKLQLPNSN